MGCPANHYFNPRTPVGCDYRTRRQSGYVERISIHAPQWGATEIAQIYELTSSISIHAPQWGATSTATLLFHHLEFQSTHPSGVRPDAAKSKANALAISIHAPQWGATDAGAARHAPWHISIHAPQWGATFHFHPRTRLLRYFNPRTPVGCDSESVAAGVAWFISIHAPQWGATPSILTIIGLPFHFNPRTPVGCDSNGQYRPKTPDAFQSTHPSGVRHATLAAYQITLNISIHAPQWGATRRLSRARRSG